jgi:HD-GYP domain-containing protein (c-di-GMP phosphodiesterase class II)
VRIVVFAVPILLSILVTSAMTQMVHRPRGITANVAWWIYMSLVGTSVLYAADVVMRRLLPLSTLLKLTLVFPDHAPARFRVALRTGTPKQLARKLQDAQLHTLGDTPQDAAEKLLELVAALSVHDRLTRGHCERVRAYTDVITKELRLAPDDASKMHWAAMIHDIGKLEVPAEILSKPVRLTDAEFEIIKTHPQAGARIAAPLAGWLGEWFHAIDHHHERWDGKGYPYGLAGTDIPLAGRIAAVADVYDVITAARSYKKPQPAADARRELARCAGTQFDPEVVRAFLGVSLGRLRLMMGPLA